MNAEPGWYPDEKDPSVTWEWDGSGWTGRTRDSSEESTTPLAERDISSEATEPTGAEWYPGEADPSVLHEWDGSTWTGRTRPGTPSEPDGGIATGIESAVKANPVSRLGLRLRAGIRRAPAWSLPAAAGLVIGLVLGGTIASTFGSRDDESARSSRPDSTTSAATTQTDLARASRSCAPTGVGAVLGDAGQTLTIDSEGDEDYQGLDDYGLDCILDITRAPQAVIAHIGQTTAMDGRQTEEWGEFEMSFSYHPDRGLDGVIEMVE